MEAKVRFKDTLERGARLAAKRSEEYPQFIGQDKLAAMVSRMRSTHQLQFLRAVALAQIQTIRDEARNSRGFRKLKEELKAH